MSIRTSSRIAADSPQPRTGPCAARDHVRYLRQDGGTYRQIATAAGLASATVHDLIIGGQAPQHSGHQQRRVYQLKITVPQRPHADGFCPGSA
jgi:hypothetical protein